MIYVFLADGFEETEALTTVDILRRAALDVQTVAVKKAGNLVTSSHNITVSADVNQNDITEENLEGVILPGGMPGTLNLENSAVVVEYTAYCADNNLIIGAICAAPSVLGKMNLLNGRKATCFPGFEKFLKNAKYTPEFTVCDGNIVTAKGMGATIPFALKLTELFKGKAVAESVQASLQCPYSYE